MKRIRLYPCFLEDWWTQQALSYYKTDSFDRVLAKLEAHVQALSDHFTVERVAGFEGCYSDPEMLLAYGLFFFPQTYARTRFALESAMGRLSLPDDQNGIDLADLGCGLGSAGLALVDFLKERSSSGIHLEGFDESEEGLDYFRRLSHGAGVTGIRFQLEKRDMASAPEWFPKDRYQWVVASFSLNEVFLGQAFSHSWVSSLLRKMKPGGVLVILEPALRETSEKLEVLRNEIAQAGEFSILAPCLHAKGCPLLVEGKFWCHEAREWDPPETLQRLNRHLFRGIRVVKFSYLILQNAVPRLAETGDPHKCRLISPLQLTNGKTTFVGCTTGGLKNTYELLHRHFTKKEIREMPERYPRGTLIRVEGAEPMKEEGRWRGRKILRDG